MFFVSCFFQDSVLTRLGIFFVDSFYVGDIFFVGFSFLAIANIFFFIFSFIID